MKRSMPRTLPPVLLLVLALLATACGPRATPAPTPAPTPDASARQLRVQQALWTAVNDNYVHDDFGGADWAAAGDAARAQIEAGLTNDEFEAAMRDMLAVLPAGTVIWETRAERLESQSADTSTYEGIGAFVAVRAEPEPRVILLAVMEDSPAQRAGLAAHDAIFAIDGEPVLAEEGLEVIQRVRGPAGSSVALTVQSPGGERREVAVERGQLTSTAQLLAGVITEADIAYFLLPTQPTEQMIDNILAAWQGMNESRALRGIILDLRIAHTGGQWPLGELLTLLGDGELGATYTREGEQPLEVTGQDFSGSQTLPLAVLVGPDTEGAPEVLAAALQASGRAQVVGLPTPGDVEGTTEIALPDGSRVFIAFSSYLTADGRDIGLEGVVPDEVVEADWDEVSDTFDPVLDAAVALLAEE
jgi:carboxyl-terminal processing protease